MQWKRNFDILFLQTLTNLLKYSKDENGRLKTDLENIRQLYNDSQKDNILLRNSLSRQEERATMINGNNQINDKEKLITQLEESFAKVTLNPHRFILQLPILQTMHYYAGPSLITVHLEN